MEKSKYFSTYELIGSTTAKKLGIDNTPSEEVLEHLKELMKALDSIREGWGAPIKVTSGYRCPELNKAVGGVKTSAHIYGYAADLIPYNNQFAKFEKYMAQWAKDNDFDQILIETSKTSKWIHFGLKNGKGEMRHQVKNIKA